jgi:hypothetical protein
MFSYDNAIVPLFLWQKGAVRPKQVGSSVLVRMAGNAYLLTAAHVSDLHTEGAFCIPSSPTGVSRFVGEVGFNLLPRGTTRKNDPVDIGYLKIAADSELDLPAQYCAVAREHLDAAGGIESGDFCVIAGFPGSRSWAKHQNKELVSSSLSFFGIAFERSKYKSLGYDPETNILINYDIKKAMYPEGDRAFPPSPEGMSGGGIFHAGSGPPRRPDLSASRLLGIMHSFKRKECYFVGTRLSHMLRLIAERFPTEVHEFIGI